MYKHEEGYMKCNLEMFTVPELDWFSDGRWQTDVK